ncbi:ferric-chelate reductase [Truncatella angustata]|uniref:ferric-chelate reductase (NADPH) n=1 Tax=Truncatella angustata TaxID=152316 RepID=A0A9P8UMR0_9PEZI|nr:ferric-chelate reductase [Truncatella angustata]KAH6654901.1 ferric-chelate reductase [Truncatella angustata]
MGGMSSSGMFQDTNMSLAQTYWYLIAGVLGLLLIVRAINFSQNWIRLRTSRTSSIKYPTIPANWYLQLWATLTAVGREISYPQIYVPTKYFSWLTPPPMGRVICLLVYWAVIIYMMCSGAIVKDAYFWERIGYRNAWVTVTQVPFLYLLASKTNVIGLIAGTSYERLNWLHRWVARTMFATATVHGFHFWSEWVLYDLVDLELQYMPIVRYGLGAWGLLLWMVVTSFRPIRAVAYEIWVAQHIIAAILFLWIVYLHVPTYARYNIWFAIAAICFDRVFRFGMLLWQNIKFNPKTTGCKGGQKFGHQTQISVVGDSITVLTIKDVHFKWSAGQHLYLWLPRVGPLEAHPYTIACAHQTPDTCICNSIQLVIRTHSGFSKRLHSFARKMQASERKQTVTALVAGPYGRPPRWDIFETLVLISASTGASFTLPILESVLQTKATICTKRIDFLLTARQGEEIGFYHDRLHEAMVKANQRGIELSVHIAVTGDGHLETVAASRSSSASGSAASHEEKLTVVERTGTFDKSAKSQGGCCCSADIDVVSSGAIPRKRLSQTSTDSHIHRSATRPDVSVFIRDAVEATGGETGVVVCGGVSLVARVRTSVAKLSDERAVHKGTGAQGIHLHVEEYCF